MRKSAIDEFLGPNNENKDKNTVNSKEIENLKQ